MSERKIKIKCAECKKVIEPGQYVYELPAGDAPPSYSYACGKCMKKVVQKRYRYRVQERGLPQ